MAEALAKVFKPKSLAAVQKRFHKPKVKTSDDAPIYVNYLESTFDLKLHNFKLGMTLCPGKHQSHSMMGIQWERDLEKDLARLKESGVTTIVTLMHKEEMEELKVPNLLGTHSARV